MPTAMAHGRATRSLDGNGMAGSLNLLTRSLLAHLAAGDQQRALQCVEGHWSRGWDYRATGCLLVFLLLLFGFLGASIAVQIDCGKHAALLGILAGFPAFLPMESLMTRGASTWRLRCRLRAKLGISLNRNSAQLWIGAAVIHRLPRTTRRPAGGRFRR